MNIPFNKRNLSGLGLGICGDPEKTEGQLDLQILQLLFFFFFGEISSGITISVLWIPHGPAPWIQWDSFPKCIRHLLLFFSLLLQKNGPICLILSQCVCSHSRLNNASWKPYGKWWKPKFSLYLHNAVFPELHSCAGSTISVTPVLHL